MNSKHLDKTRTIKDKVVAAVYNLVTPNIRYCEIRCIVNYRRHANIYIVSIGTLGPKGGYLKLGKTKVFSSVMNIFGEGSVISGPLVQTEYNGHHFRSFRGLS